MSDKICPMMNGPCVEAKCRFWVYVGGVNPNTGAAVDRFDCTFAVMPILLMEISQQTRQAGASVDQLRADHLNQGRAIISNLLRTAKQDAEQSRFRLPFFRNKSL